MHLVITILVVGAALLAIGSAVALVHAIWTAEEGVEDSNGYHALPPQEADCHPKTALDSEESGGAVNPWDQIEGASCPIDLGRSFVRIQRGKFFPH